MEKPTTFTLKYRFRLFATLNSLFLTIVFGIFEYLLIESYSPFISVLFFCLFLLFSFTLILQVILPGKKYHFFVNQSQNILMIDRVIRSSQKILLTDIKGVALGWQTTKGTTIYLLQLAVSPSTWCQFYRKEAKKDQYERDYEELYIVISATNQKDSEMNELVDFIVQSGIPKRSFVKSVLGKYPGIPRIDKYQKNAASENPIVIKQKRRQHLSNVLQIAFVIFAIIYIVTRLLSIVG